MIKMSDCSSHKKDVAGISDMKALAEMIGDLHYEALSELLFHFEAKLKSDATKDFAGGRIILGKALNRAAFHTQKVKIAIEQAWQISKPFMTDKA